MTYLKIFAVGKDIWVVVEATKREIKGADLRTVKVYRKREFRSIVFRNGNVFPKSGILTIRLSNWSLEKPLQALYNILHTGGIESKLCKSAKRWLIICFVI